MRTLIGFLLSISIGAAAAAQQIAFTPGTTTLPELAKSVIPQYQEADRLTFLDNLFRMQSVAGDYADALATLQSWREAERKTLPAFADWVNVQYEIDIRAKAAKGAAFDDDYRAAFRDVIGNLSAPASALAVRAIAADGGSFDRQLQRDMAAAKGKNSIAIADAVKLLRDAEIADTYRTAARLGPALIAEDDARRYVIQKDVTIKTADGGTVCAMLVRPKTAGERLPSLLELTIYADPSLINWTRLGAAHGYNTMTAFVRGKACSPDRPMPYEHDAADAEAAINWMAAQPWSDGRVGMYGGSYSGGAVWAAAKRMPKALKAIMAGAPAAAGLDVPMEGNVVWNFIYPWPFYTTDKKTNDDAVYNDTARWTRLNEQWYTTGRAYRDLDKIDGTPNPIFDKWISHPSYDAYWQSLIPYGREFSRINIPVLQTAGYFFGGPGAALYYFTQHQKYRPNAEDYLLIGPYHHFNAQFGTYGLLGQPYPTIAGYKLDPVAMIDIEALRYQWFDSVFKNAPRPALLQDKVNYEVMGANVWKHAPSVDAMSNTRLRFYLNGKKLDARQQPPSEAATTLTVNLADRSDVKRQAPGGGVQDRAIDTWNGIEFVSDPLPAPVEMSGLISGVLDFTANKKDFDFEIDTYELTPSGDYIQIPPYWARASYVRDLTQRHLLTPNARQRLPFKAVRLASLRMSAGSRVVAVLSIIKGTDRQINYGTGKDVNDETIKDAGAPLKIDFFSSSYIDLPVREAASR